jgi:hypothetical protein
MQTNKTKNERKILEKSKVNINKTRKITKYHVGK